MIFPEREFPELEARKKSAIQRINRLTETATWFIDSFGLGVSDGFQEITPQELRKLGLGILNSTSLEEAYALMAQEPSDGSLSYYDRLIAEPQHLDTYKRLDRILRETETQSVDISVDLGSGTGFCAMLLSQISKHVVAVDTSRELLEVASRQLQRLVGDERPMQSFETRQISATALDFPDASIDIATSNALTHYLTYQEQETFYREIYRVLKPGGRYFEPQQDGSFDSYYFSSPRAILAKEVAGTILLARNPDKFFKGTKRLVPNVGDYGFNLKCHIFQEHPFTAQVVRAVKT